MRTRYHLLLIAFVGLIAYSNTFHVPLQFDDLPNIVDNPIIKNLGNFISSSKGYAFNPRRFIGYLSFSLNYRLGAFNVVGYHIVNLAIHIVSAILVYFLVASTLSMVRQAHHDRCHTEPVEGHTSPYIALFSALLFVAHPVQTQAVTYIVQRFASLATMFYLLSVVMYIKARTETRNAVRGTLYAIALLSAALAMKTKETAFTLPVIIILYEFIFLKSTLKKRLLFLIPALCTMLIIPLSILGTNRPLGEIISDVSEALRVQSSLPRWDYLMTQMRVITTYIRLIFLPAGQNLDYDYPLYHSLFQLPVLLSFLFLSSILGIGVFLLCKTRRTLDSRLRGNDRTTGAERSTLSAERLVGFGILWFFITLSVESSIVPIEDVIFEHRLYLALPGAFIAIVTAAFTAAAGRKNMERTVAIVLALVTIVFTGVTYARNTVWQDRIRLWEDVAHKSPGKARVHNNLGSEYMVKGFLEKAANEFQMAILLKPDYAEAHYNLGVIYQALNKFDEAREQYFTTIKLRPKDAWAHLNLGVLYSGAFNQSDKAEKEFLAAVNLMPDFAEAHFNLGYIYLQKGQKEKAGQELTAALTIRPDYEKARQLLKTVSQ